MGLRSAVAAATAISVSAAAASYTGHASSNLRVGVYVGGGISPASAGGYVTAMQALVQQGTIASAMNFSDPEVEALNAVGNPIDVLVVPGGYSPDEGTAMTPTGLNAIRTFVLSGGGYVSSCAGGSCRWRRLNSCCYVRWNKRAQWGLSWCQHSVSSDQAAQNYF